MVAYIKLQLSRSEKSVITATIQNALLPQDYVNWEDDPELAHIETIVGDLQNNPDDKKLWDELVRRINKLT